MPNIEIAERDCPADSTAPVRPVMAHTDAAADASTDRVMLLRPETSTTGLMTAQAKPSI